MPTINAYLTFEGNCEEAFNFYKSVFGGEFEYIGRFSEMPDNPEYTIDDTEKDKIMHVSLPISKETILMGSDTGGNSSKIVYGNNFSISVNTNSKVEADKIFQGLSKGGKATMPMSHTFWGSYFGMITDQFGINWMMNYGQEQG